MRLVIIGLGGIGTKLCPDLLQWLNYEELKHKLFDSIILIDGDKYEDKNSSRQDFQNTGVNKAQDRVDEYKNKYDKLNFEFWDEYITKDNISKILKDEDIVMLCVDNHKSRMVLENHIKSKKVKELTIISGGNDLYDGNVMIIQKENGQVLSPLFSLLHPEIKTSKELAPYEEGCDAMGESAPQIGLVNSSIAEIMRRTLFAMFHSGINYYEVFVNCLTGSTRSVNFKKTDFKMFICNEKKALIEIEEDKMLIKKVDDMQKKRFEDEDLEEQEEEEDEEDES